MASGNCSREPDVIAAAWGERPDLDVDPSLAAHLGECGDCAEIAWMARVFRDERNIARTDAHPPSAGVVWWRAQRRARENAARKAAKPIALIHAIALGCSGAATVAVLSLCLGRTSTMWKTVEVTFSTAARDAVIRMTTLGFLPLGTLLVVAASLVLAPVAIYLAVRDV